MRTINLSAYPGTFAPTKRLATFSPVPPDKAQEKPSLRR